MATYGTMASPTAEPAGAGAAVDSKPEVAHGQAMEKARDAFAAGDLEASAAAHRAKAGIVASPEHHGGAGSDYIKSIVFGGLDGIITSYAVVASVGGANLPLTVTLITGIAKLLGDGLAMGIGDAISEGAEHSFIRGERAREKWEMANFPEGEIKEMEEIYVSKGFNKEEAATVIGTLTRKREYHDYFVDHMMVQELGQMVPDDDAAPWKDGLVTFISFMIFGSLPLIPYVIFYFAEYKHVAGQLGIASAITLLTLFALGAVQARIIRQSMLKQGVLMAINGGMAAAAAYGIGRGLQAAFGLNETCE